MENKKDLAKIALAALILASATPINGQADIEAHGIVLAAGCASHGCPAAKNSRDNNPASNNTRVPNQSSSDYSNQPYGTNPEYGSMTGSNREHTGKDYDYNRTTVTTSNATLTEAQLLSMLSSQGRAIYLSLDPEAKALAIQLASQDSYRDKNLAIKEAQRRMNEHHGALNR